MKKYFFILLFAFAIYSCGDKKEGGLEPRYIPSKGYFSETNLKQVNISEINFGQLVKNINALYIADSIPYVQIENNNKTTQIIFFRNDYGYFVERNNMQIGKDSIYIGGKYPIEELAIILKKHYENNNGLPFFSEGSSKAYCEILLDSEANSSLLENSLSNLILEFDKLNNLHNDSLELKIGLRVKRQLNIPPAPSKQ